MKMKNNKKGGWGAYDQARGFLLVLFEHLQTPRTWPYLGSTPKGVIHEKRYKNIKITRCQHLQTNGIYSLNKIPTKPTCNIKTKTNNIALLVNPNSHA